MSVTIFVEVRDDELFLERCVRSVLAPATSLPVELRTIEPGSSDDSRLVLDELARKDPRLHRHHTWPEALAQATGAWLGTLAADGALYPEALELLRQTPRDGSWLFGLTNTEGDLAPGPSSTFRPRAAARTLLHRGPPLAWLTPSLSGGSARWAPRSLALETAHRPRRGEAPPTELAARASAGLVAVAAAPHPASHHEVLRALATGFALRLEHTLPLLSAREQRLGAARLQSSLRKLRRDGLLEGRTRLAHPGHAVLWLAEAQSFAARRAFTVEAVPALKGALPAPLRRGLKRLLRKATRGG